MELSLGRAGNLGAEENGVHEGVREVGSTTSEISLWKVFSFKGRKDNFCSVHLTVGFIKVK